MKRIFKTRHFRRWMRKTDRGEDALCMAVAEMNAGLIDADLGGFVVKKRVALPGRGKRGSTRTLLATNKHNRWFFIFGFEKMIVAISTQKSWNPCKISLQTC